MEATWEMYDGGETFRVSWNFEETTITTQWSPTFLNSVTYGGEEWDWSLSDFGKEPVTGFNFVDSSEENPQAVHDVRFFDGETEFLHDLVTVTSATELV